MSRPLSASRACQDHLSPSRTRWPLRYPVAMKRRCLGAALLLFLAACEGAPGGSRIWTPGRTPPLVPVSAEQLLDAVRQSGAPAVVLNVWATWCAPCREEFPDLIRLWRAYRDRGLRLMLVSADFEDQAGAARRFLARQGVDFVTFLKTGDDMGFIEGLDRRWTGALPATFVYDRGGRLRHFQEGRSTYEALELQVLAALDANHSNPKETAR